jgi:hypothetical protein
LFSNGVSTTLVIERQEDEKLSTNSESIRVWNAAAVAYLKVFLHQSARETEKLQQQKIQSGYRVDQERFEPGTSKIQALGRYRYDNLLRNYVSFSSI